VLPFRDLSGDPQQEYFGDGITEDIIAALARIHWLFVISRTSTLVYKSRSPIPASCRGSTCGTS
jgi:adenylate cyclase